MRYNRDQIRGRQGYRERNYGTYDSPFRGQGRRAPQGFDSRYDNEFSDTGPYGTRGGYERYSDGYRQGYRPTQEQGGYDYDQYDSFQNSRTGEPWGGKGDADEYRISEIMTANPEAVTPDTLLVEVAQRMKDLDVGVIPVVESEENYRLSGLITDRDIAVRAVAQGLDVREAKVSDFMTSGVRTLHPGDHVRDVLTLMKKEQVRRVPVVDEENRLVGIVAQADLAVNYAGLDLNRELEVEETIERISEPARPSYQNRSNRRVVTRQSPRRNFAYDRDYPTPIRQGWQAIRRGIDEIRDVGREHGWI